MRSLGPPRRLSSPVLAWQWWYGRCLRRHRAWLNRTVALKIASNQDAQTAKSFLLEPMVNAVLEHPNVVPVHALGRGKETGSVFHHATAAGKTWADAFLDLSLEEHLASKTIYAMPWRWPMTKASFIAILNQVTCSLAIMVKYSVGLGTRRPLGLVLSPAVLPFDYQKSWWCAPTWRLKWLMRRAIMTLVQPPIFICLSLSL